MLLDLPDSVIYWDILWFKLESIMIAEWDYVID